MLKVPRLREAYIQQHGVDTFIEKFAAVVAESQAMLNERAANTKRLEDRKVASMKKHKVAIV